MIEHFDTERIGVKICGAVTDFDETAYYDYADCFDKRKQDVWTGSRSLPLSQHTRL